MSVPNQEIISDQIDQQNEDIKVSLSQFPQLQPQLPMPQLPDGGQAVGSNYGFGDTRPICIYKVRQLFANESYVCKRSTIQVLDKESLIFTSTDGDSKEDLMNLTRDKLFRVDRSISPELTNEQIANMQFDYLIESLLKGISHTMILLGAQSSGKTHSLFGTISDPGMILYFMKKLFIRKMKSPPSSIIIQLSMMKYSEDFYDLLCPTEEPLNFKHTRYGVAMPGISNIRIDSLREFFVYLRLGLKEFKGRDIHKEIAYPIAIPSERGHAIIKLKIIHKIFQKVQVTKRSQGGSGLVQEEKIEQKIFESDMIFIDCDHFNLNEKIEYKSIQQSLLALENIMQYVYEINKGYRHPQFHIPYEESKFTNYFKSYLFGTNQLMVMGNLSPFRDDVEESMKTARLVQWAFNCRNSVRAKVYHNIHAFNKISSKEVPFVQKMHLQANLLGEDVKLYLNGSFLRPEEKETYLNSVTQIISEQKHILTRNLRLVNTYLGLRDQLATIKMEGIRAKYEEVKGAIKSNDIKELYLVKHLPQLSEELQKDIDIFQKNILKKIKEINSYFSAFQEVKDKFIEMFNLQQESMKALFRPMHCLALKEIGLSSIEYIRWSQDNAIRSFEANEPSRMNLWMDEISTKIFSFLGHLLRHLDSSEQQQGNYKIKSFKRIPSEISKRSLQSVIFNQNDFKLLNPNQIIGEEHSYKPHNLNLFPQRYNQQLTPQISQNNESNVKEALKNFLSLSDSQRKKSKSSQQQGKIDNVNSSLFSPNKKVIKIKELHHFKESLSKQFSFGGKSSFLFNSRPSNDQNSLQSSFKDDITISEIPDLKTKSSYISDLPPSSKQDYLSYNLLLQQKNSFVSQKSLEDISKEQINYETDNLQSLSEFGEEEEQSDEESVEQIKYSISDLQRINCEIQEKKQKFKQDQQKIVEEAEIEEKKFKDNQEDIKNTTISTKQYSDFNIGNYTKSSLKNNSSSNRSITIDYSKEYKEDDDNKIKQSMRSSFSVKKAPQLEMKLTKNKEFSLKKKIFILDEKNQHQLQSQYQFEPQSNHNNNNTVFSKTFNLLYQIVSKTPSKPNIKTNPDYADSSQLNTRYPNTQQGTLSGRFTSSRSKNNKLETQNTDKLPILHSLNLRNNSCQGMNITKYIKDSGPIFSLKPNENWKVLDSNSINQLKRQTKLIQGDIKQLLFQYQSH